MLLTFCQALEVLSNHFPSDTSLQSVLKHSGESSKNYVFDHAI